MFDEELQFLLNSPVQAYSLLKYLGNEDFERELIKFTQSGFAALMWSTFPSQKSRDLVMLGLTFIALKYYDGALWPHVYEKYSGIYNDQKILESKIRDGVLSLLTSKYNCERKHYQIPVMNSIVPFNYASDYIEFVHDIYVTNMECNLENVNVEEELLNVFNVIKEEMSDLDDIFQYNYEQNYSKTYKLIKATKNIIKSGIKLNELILFTKDIIKKLDNFYDGKNNFINYYIDEAFKNWEDKYCNDKTFRKAVKSNFIKSKNPYYTFLSSNGNVFLHTPTLRRFGKYNTEQLYIEILEDNVVIYSDNNLKVNNLMGGIEILQKDYKIVNPLNKISCKIYCGEQLLYNSGDFLYRDYILFNDAKELSNNKTYTGIVYFVYKNSCDRNLFPLKDCEGYRVSYKEVKDGDEYILDNRFRIAFSNVLKSGIVGGKVFGMEIIDNSEAVPIYKSVDEICLTSISTNKYANKIRINGSYLESGSEIIKTVEQSNSIAYFLDFKNFSNDANIYTVELIDIRNNKVTSGYKFLYDKDFEINQMIVDNYTISLTYKGNFDMTDKAGRKYYEFNLPINDLNKKRTYLNIDGNLYKCKINLTIPHYTVDDSCVYTFNSSLTSDDITYQSKLFYNIDNCDKVQFRVGNELGYKTGDTIYELSIKTLNHRTYLDLSEFLNFKNYKVIEIRFSSNGKELNCLQIYNDIVFDSENSYFSIDSNNEEVEFRTVLLGKRISDQVYIELSNRFGIISEQILDDVDNINIFKLGNKIQKVHYKLYRNIKELIGFKAIERQDIILEGDFAYYPFNDLIGKYLIVDTVQFEGCEDNEDLIEVKNLNIKLVKRFKEFYFLGYLYENKYGKIRPFDKVGAVLINLSQVYKSELNHSCIDANISVFYDDFNEEDAWNDLLQYDEKNQTILDNYSKNGVPYISNYRINLTLGERQYANFKSNRQS